MSFARTRLFPFFVVVLGACHESAATSSPLPSSSTSGVRSAGAVPTSRAANSEAETTKHVGSGFEPHTDVAPDSGASPPAASSAAAASAPAPAAREGVNVLLDAEGKPLPQTNERPATDTPAFQRRIAAVAASIISGDAEPALDSFFPLVAYAQVKDVAKPERDYKFRLLSNFKRDVLEYHRALGRDAAAATFSGITVPEKDAKWMEPGSEGNKVGYFRVLRSHLRFTLPGGKFRDFELTSLISWRGEWYVVHLHGFK